jgi:hypothetical protein
MKGFLLVAPRDLVIVGKLKTYADGSIAIVLRSVEYPVTAAPGAVRGELKVLSIA